MAVSMIIQVGVTATTARLLDPKDFGLIAMANVLLRLGGYVAQMGVGRALIQRSEVDERDVRAAFTSSTALGLIVAVLVYTTAPIAGAFYETPEVVPVIRWLALMFVFSGLGATAQALLRRNLRFRGSSFVEVLAYSLGYALPGLWLATSGYGVWSLVVATLGQAAMASGLAYVLVRHPVRFTLAWQSHRRLLAFGTKVSAISFLEFLGATLDSLVIGRFGTASQLGLYNRAYMLASLPTYQVNNGIAKVLFPVLAAGQADRAAFKEALARTSEMAIKVVIPMGVGMALAAPEMVGAVLGPQWVAAVSVFSMLAIGLSVNLLATFPGMALEAQGILRGKAVVQAGFVGLLAVALLSVVLLKHFNLTWVTAVIAVSMVVRTLGYFALGWRTRTFEVRTLQRLAAEAMACTLLSVGTMGGVLVAVRVAGILPLARLAIVVVTGAALLAFLFRGEARRYLKGRTGERAN